MKTYLEMKRYLLKKMNVEKHLQLQNKCSGGTAVVVDMCA